MVWVGSEVSGGVGHIAQRCVIFITSNHFRLSRSPARCAKFPTSRACFQQLPDFPRQRFVRKRLLKECHIFSQEDILGNYSGCVPGHKQHFDLWTFLQQFLG